MGRIRPGGARSPRYLRRRCRDGRALRGRPRRGIGQIAALFDKGGSLPQEARFAADGPFTFAQHERPHESPDLETLIPADLAEPPLEIDSVCGSAYGSSLLNKGLRQLGVRPKDCQVTSGVGGGGPDTLMVTVYRVPGAAADALAIALAPVAVKPSKGKWADAEIASRRVRLAEGSFGDVRTTVAFWAVDELFVRVAGPRHLVERAVSRLPGRPR